MVSQHHRKKRKIARAQDKSHRSAATIVTLPDDVLLEIFDFCRRNHDQHPSGIVWDWHLLVRVCQRWRQIVLASPHRLHLRILCTHRTPVRKNLGGWPAFPIVIEYGYPGKVMPDDEDNVIAALEHPDRVCDIRLYVTGSQLKKVAMVTQEPFLMLTRLSLFSDDENVPVLPEGFLGRSALCLRAIDLDGIPFPALPRLLLSAANLVTLRLIRIPPTGYISPEVMAVGLAALTRLRYLSIQPQSPNARPDQIHLPPATRTVLPALTCFVFWGVREYLEDFAARIDAPRLNSTFIYYSNQLVDFQVPQLANLINRSENLMRSLPRHCHLVHQPNCVSFLIGDTTRNWAGHLEFSTRVHIDIRCQGVDWQVSHIVQAFSQMSAILSNMVHFSINLSESRCRLEGMDDIEWLQLLRLSSVRTLFVSEQFAGHVARALQDIAGVMPVVTEVLPALDLLCLEHQPVSSVDRFIAVRQDSGRPVTFVDTKWVFDETLLRLEHPSPGDGTNVFYSLGELLGHI